jgi:hypothetical protein
MKFLTYYLKLTKSSMGSDKLPHWLFRKCARVLAPVVIHVFSITLTCGICPAAWKCAVVTSIPNVSLPTAFKDLHLIFVTIILS